MGAWWQAPHASKEAAVVVVARWRPGGSRSSVGRWKTKAVRRARQLAGGRNKAAAVAVARGGGRQRSSVGDGHRRRQGGAAAEEQGSSGGHPPTRIHANPVAVAGGAHPRWREEPDGGERAQWLMG